MIFKSLVWSDKHNALYQTLALFIVWAKFCPGIRARSLAACLKKAFMRLDEIKQVFNLHCFRRKIQYYNLYKALICYLWLQRFFLINAKANWKRVDNVLFRNTLVEVRNFNANWDTSWKKLYWNTDSVWDLLTSIGGSELWFFNDRRGKRKLGK